MCIIRLEHEQVYNKKKTKLTELQHNSVNKTANEKTSVFGPYYAHTKIERMNNKTM